MENVRITVDGLCINEVKVKQEEDEDEFRSCCEDENELKEMESYTENDLDEHFATMYFKGVSIVNPGDSGSGLSGIGVVIERCSASPVQVQKKLEFYVEESVADYLALLDGLTVAIENNIRYVCALTDSQALCDQISQGEFSASPLLVALRQRILEQASYLEYFVLKIDPVNRLKALNLAQVAVGVVTCPAKGTKISECCSICCEEKLSSMVLTLRCSHTFCSHCVKIYVEGKIKSSQVPIRCPQLKCKYCISVSECRSFLPVISYESLKRALAESDILFAEQIYCPYSNCSALLDPHECLSTRSNSDNSCVECPVCHRFICVDCGVSWHFSMTCDEYQNRPVEVRDASDMTVYRVALNKRWKRCHQCRRMLEINHDCYHTTCWCGYEFCCSCGVEYRNGQQMCQCTFWDSDYPNDLATHHTQQFEQWPWDSFESSLMTMNAYSEQERSQLALIQRFMAGGFSLTDLHPSQSPPRRADSYVDAMKDLHQLPWLERFVSVISDNYYEDLTNEV